jgi:hemerythrin-like domain-containing protein
MNHTPPTSSPYARFRRDHARVRLRIDALEAAIPAHGRSASEPVLRRHLRAIERQFDTHLAAEEAVLYPLLARVLPAAAPSLRPLHDEHEELRAILASLKAALATPQGRERDEQIAVQLRDFVDLLRVHIRKEESVVFDVSERVLRPGELRGLRRQLASFAPRALAEPRVDRKERHRS